MMNTFGDKASVAGGLLFFFEIAADDSPLVIKYPRRYSCLLQVIFFPRRKNSDSESRSIDTSFRVFVSGR